MMIVVFMTLDNELKIECVNNKYTNINNNKTKTNPDLVVAASLSRYIIFINAHV